MLSAGTGCPEARNNPRFKRSSTSSADFCWRSLSGSGVRRDRRRCQRRHRHQRGRSVQRVLGFVQERRAESSRGRRSAPRRVSTSQSAAALFHSTYSTRNTAAQGSRVHASLHMRWVTCSGRRTGQITLLATPTFSTRWPTSDRSTLRSCRSREWGPTRGERHLNPITAGRATARGLRRSSSRQGRLGDQAADRQRCRFNGPSAGARRRITMTVNHYRRISPKEQQHDRYCKRTKHHRRR